MAKSKQKLSRNEKSTKRYKLKSNSSEQTISRLSDLSYCPVIAIPVRKNVKSNDNMPSSSLSNVKTTNINSTQLFHDPTTDSNNVGNNSSLGFIFKKVFKFLKLCPDGSNCYC